jgi:hypothetical protein
LYFAFAEFSAKYLFRFKDNLMARVMDAGIFPVTFPTATCPSRKEEDFPISGDAIKKASVP